MVKISKSALMFTVIVFSTIFVHAQKNYYITDFGAKGDGVTLNSKIIQYAVDYVNARGGGRLIFTEGKYLTGTFYLKSNVTLHIEKNAVILGSNNPFDYVKDAYLRWTAMIFAVKQENIGISGEGVIDGRGFQTACNMCDYIHKTLVEDPLKYDRPNESNRPENIYFRECRNVRIEGVTLKNPASWNQTYDQCVNLLVQNIKVDSKSYWNNDGIDIVDCDSVCIRGCYMDAADDVYCLKSHSSSNVCQNVLIEDCVGRSSANGLKFGTVSRGGFKNITVKNLTIFDTYRSAITFAAVDGGFVDSILVDGLKAVNTGNAIYLRTGKRNRDDRTGSIKNVNIRNVYVEVPKTKADSGYSYEGPIEDLPRNISPASIVGTPDSKIENIILENIEIVYPGGSDSTYAYRGCREEELAEIPEMLDAYPEFSQFKELPAWGFFIRHAKNINLKNVKLTLREKDYRPSIVSYEVEGLKLNNVQYSEPNSKGKKQVVKVKTK